MTGTLMLLGDGIVLDSYISNHVSRFPFGGCLRYIKSSIDLNGVGGRSLVRFSDVAQAKKYDEGQTIHTRNYHDTERLGS